MQNIEIKYLGTVTFSLASIHTMEILLGLKGFACRKALFLADPQCPYRCRSLNRAWLDKWVCLSFIAGRRCRDRMVVGFTTTYEIGAYHH